MDIDNNFITLLEQFQRINNKINKAHNFTIYSDDNVVLNTGSVHLIDAIGKHRDCNITEISNILGITKGAVSQLVAKLSLKGLIIKTKDEFNDKEVKLKLTKYGKTVYDIHEKLHAEMYSDLKQSLNTITQDEINHLEDILSKIDKYMDVYLNNSK